MTGPRGGPGFVALRIGVVAAVFGLALLSLREHSVRAPEGHSLASLNGFFPNHPANLERRVLEGSVAAAMAGKSLDDPNRAAARQLMRAQPLSPTPFLVAGADAQLAGSLDDAERHYRAARLRDPRASTPRLLLADLYLRSDRVRLGVSEMLSIARVAPRSAPPIGPAIAAYARSPGAIANLRPAFASDPALRDQVIAFLAADAANADLVRQLATPRPRNSEPRPWEATFLTALVNAGRGAEAKTEWSRWNGVPGDKQAVVNPEFRPLKASPPFNWELQSGSTGLAEIAENGGLTVIHYGREEALLARQLLVLQAGTYRIATRARTDASSSPFLWVLRCAGGNIAGSVPLDRPDGGVGEVTVPDDCPAQWLELRATVVGGESTVEGRISSVGLVRVQ